MRVEVRPGEVIQVAEWMLDRALCAGMEMGEPRVAVTSLIELHRLPTERGFRQTSLSLCSIASMVLPAPDLPDDVAALKAMVLAMAREQAANEARLAAAAAEIARLQAVEKSANERIANLTSILKVLQRAQHGKRSERLRLAVNDEQVSFAFEDAETGLSAIQSELDRAAKDNPKRAPRPRKGFAAHLERIEEVIEPEVPADCAGLEKVLIGEDRSERLNTLGIDPTTLASF